MLLDHLNGISFSSILAVPESTAKKMVSISINIRDCIDAES